ncbi:MAG TPA: TonB family protein [Terriglobales bacterium]|nr:TonB family protein [Terriglobales bacterium]
MFEDCLGLHRENGRARRGKSIALAASLVLHGLLIYGFVHARFTIKLLTVRARVQDLRIAPPVRLSVPRVVGGPAQGRPPQDLSQAGPPGGGAGGPRRAAPPPAPAPVPPGAAAAAPGPTAQGPVIPSLAAKFREFLGSRYRTGQGPDLSITLAPPGTKPTAGATSGKGTAPDFYQYLTGGPGSGEMPSGAGDGKRGGGAGGQRASISIPLKGYNLGPWAQKVLELIMKNWELPYAPGLTERTWVKVIVVVKKNGELASVELAEGSARDVLDEAALGAVRASLPFPALPDDFPGDFLEASVEFTYHD